MKEAPLLNRVLFPLDLSSFRVVAYTTDGKRPSLVWRPDGDIEELDNLSANCIARGAVAIAFPAVHSLASYLPSLPTDFQKRTVVVDKKQKAASKAAALLGPILDEWGLEIKNFAPLYICSSRHAHSIHVGSAIRDYVAVGRLSNGELRTRIDHDKFDLARTVVAGLFEVLHTLVLGIDHQLEITIPLVETRSCLKTLGEISGSREAQARISVLTGISRQYECKEVGALWVAPDSSHDNVRLFLDLAEDEVYQRLSQEVASLGLDGRVSRAISRVNTSLGRFLTNKRFGKFLRLGERVIAVASPIKIPVSDVVRDLLPEPYLPPVVPIIRYVPVAAPKATNALGEADG